MADNIAVTAGTGTNIAADDIGGGLLVQRVKATWGPDGTANDADVATGKPLPIQVRSATGLIPLGEPTDAKSTATDTTSVSGISVWKQISASIQTLVTAFGAALTRGSGAVDSNTQRMILASDSPGVLTLGQAAKAASVPVTIADMNSGEYETVAASQTDQVMGATGGTGDYLSHVIVIPAVAACGLVTIKDNTTAIISFVGGGTTAMPTVAPFVIPVGIYSASGAWKITTGANVSCVAVGNFT